MIFFHLPLIMASAFSIYVFIFLIFREDLALLRQELQDLQASLKVFISHSAKCKLYHMTSTFSIVLCNCYRKNDGFQEN